MDKLKVFQPPKLKQNARTRQLQKNNTLDNIYKVRLYDLAMSRFKWDNLPEEIDERYLEYCLNSYGTMAFFKDEVIDQWVILPATIAGKFDLYMNPVKMNAWSISGFHRILEKGTFVPIYNNMMRTATFSTLDWYAEQLYEIDMTRLVNVKAQKTPILLKGSQKQKLSLNNIYLNYDGNVPMMLVDESLGDDFLTAVNTEAPYHGGELTELRRKVEGEALVYLGYNTQESTFKRERLLAGELTAAQSDSSASRFSPLVARRQAAEQMSKMCGRDISVNFRQDTSSIIEMENALDQYDLTETVLNKDKTKSDRVGGNFNE